ncbi:MAG TPA: hypothetical protein PLI45_02530 [Candidatus Woesebacteria bacterium]|nr:hypothetical protein [Candidatus Woesebacteria bacterium]
MNTSVLYSFENSLSYAFNQVVIGIVNFIPSLLGSIVLFLVGLLVAGWLKTLTEKLINLTKLGGIVKNAAIKEFLKNAQITSKIETIIGEVVRWIVIILFFVASVNVLGLTSFSDFLNNIIRGIPTLIAAILILMVGIVIAGFLEKMVKGSLGSKDPAFSRLMGKIVSYATLTIFVLASISQLGIASFFIQTTFIGFIAALAIGIGISLGLGSKDIIKTLLEGWYKNLKKK